MGTDIKIVAFHFFLLVSSFVTAQKVSVNPVITPVLFHYNDQITVTYDVTGTTMASLEAAYIWVWIPNSNINAKYDINPASSNPSVTNNAKCSKSTANGKVIFSITFKPSDFFSSDISTQIQLGILLKGDDWGSNSIYQTTDDLINFLIGSNFQVTLTAPSQKLLFVTEGSSISVQATASAASDFLLVINNKKFDSLSSTTNYTKPLIVSDSVKFYQVFLTVKSGTTTDTLAFRYLISQVSPPLARPLGIIDGINYNPADATKATLCFWAPNKTSVYAFGDFTNWNVDPTYLMNKDGEHFWVEVIGLTPGKEYAFQYLVNDSLRIADPYTDKILEPQDNLIPASTYPNLKTIPAKALSSQWYFNHFSVLQTAQVPYPWQITNFQKPAKEKLVIYELLIRDFFDSSHRNFQSLIDTLSYFKRLGINAVELMPVAEFNGEIGWGYNPTSMFAVQKYYGTKNKLKEFVDKCHANGIAVIMDLVMNHQDLPNSYAMLDYDFINGHPKSTNKWFNVQAPHPYSVFNDLNHASPYTQKYLDTINYYWINEYKIDGYRYDLSKGFTQTVSNESTVGNYDPSRINILQRMANVLWSHFPDAYIILEHFADNSEETVLANYQVNQGRGMMLWENFNYAYNQNTMGYVSGSDISAMYYGNKGWTAPRAVGYMESHDEERLMYKNLQYGNSDGNYSVKTLTTALQRMMPADLMFYTIPGPKMLWEFGELGYDQSINTCKNLSVNDSCRLTPKPVLWTYLQDANRKSLGYHIQDLIRLRKNYDVFTINGSAQITSGASSLVQQMTLKNTPYTSTPHDSSQMNVQIAANFDVSNQTVSIFFPHAGTWYDYYNQGTPVNIATTGISLPMEPGTYKLYTDVPIKKPTMITAIKDMSPPGVSLFPNPTNGKFHVEVDGTIISLQARTIMGSFISPNRIDEMTWDVSGFSTGLYILEINTDKGIVRKKLIIN